MTTTTLQRFNVATRASKRDRRLITVAALDDKSARTVAENEHRRLSGLPANATVLTVGCKPARTATAAPRPMTKAEQAHMARLARKLTAARNGGNDAA